MHSRVPCFRLILIVFGFCAAGIPVMVSAQTFTLSQTLDDPTVTGFEDFGFSIALDGNHVLVGAPRDKTQGTNVGQAHLYDVSSGALLRTFDDPTQTFSDEFGLSVALSGNHVLIGAQGDDTNGNGVGQAHLFDATTGALLQTFDDPTVTLNDRFGWSVAVDGNNVLIGAFGDDTNGTDVGQAYLFDALSGNLLQTFDDPTVTGADAFGSAVAIDGNNILIGANGDNTNGVEVGQAHLFDALTGALLRTFDDPTVSSNDLFGISVAIEGNRALIGAAGHETSGFDVGQAHLFDVTTGALLQTFDDPALTNGDQFGISVALDGNSVLVGARNDDTDGFDVGQAHLFNATTGALLQTFSDPTPNPAGRFGQAVAIDGNNLAIGANMDDSGGTIVGQAHLFSSLSTDPIVVDPETTGATDVVSDPFGTPVTITNPVTNPLNVATLAVGDTAAGALLVQDGGALTTSQGIFVGNAATGVGDLQIDGAATLVDSAGSTDVGWDGDGSLTITGGATLQNGGDFRVGTNTGSTGAVTLIDSTITAGDDLVVGVAGEGTLNQSGGLVDVTDDFAVGSAAGSVGSYSLSAGQLDVGDQAIVGSAATAQGTFTMTGGTLTTGTDVGASDPDLEVGEQGSGTFTQSGGTVNVGDDLVLARSAAGSSGTYELSGGQLIVDDILTVGSLGTATFTQTGGQLDVSSETNVSFQSGSTGALTIQSGSANLSGELNIGLLSGSDGAVVVDGAGASLSVATDVFVGEAGTGSLTIQSGATVDVGNQLHVGFATGSSGTVTMSGGTLSTGTDVGATDPDMEIGVDGTGVFTQTGGTTTIAQDLVAALNAGSDGTIEIQAGTMTVGAGAFIGNRGDGVLNVTGSGQLDVASPFFNIADTAGSTGEVTVDGPTAQINAVDIAVGGRQIAAGGVGSLTVSDGALNASGTIRIWSPGTLNIDGGVVTTNSLLDTDGGALNHSDGTLTIDGGTFDNGSDVLLVGSTAGNPLMRFINGATATESSLRIGRLDGQAGAVEINGSGSLITTDVDVFVGRFAGGSGTLTVTNGGQLDAGDDFLLGDDGGEGIATIEQGGIVNANDTVIVGRLTGAASTLNLSSGGVLTNGGDFLVAVGPGSEGHVNLTGAGTQLNVNGTTTNGDLIVGRDAGVATLSIADGAAVNVANEMVLSRVAGSSGTVTMTGGTLTTGVGGGATDPDLEVGTAGVGVFNQSGGSINVAGDLILGASATGDGTTNLSGGSVIASTLLVGDEGTGALTISNGATMDIGFGLVGEDSGSTGSVVVDGVGSSLGISNSMLIGDDGSGSLTVQNGGTITSTEGFVGIGSTGGSGVVHIDGAGSSWSVVGSLSVGTGTGVAGSNGSLNITNGGSLSNGSTATIGGSNGGSNGVGVVTVDGPSSTWTNTDALNIGVLGDGTLNVVSGGSVTNTHANLGVTAGDSGVVLVDGTGSSWTNTDVLTVGSDGTGSVTVSGGGSASSSDTLIGAGSPGSPAGTVSVDGVGSTFATSNFLRVGDSSNGTLSITASGAATAFRTRIGDSAGSTGNLTVDGVGSSLQISASGDGFYVGSFGSGTVNITNGGAISNNTASVGTFSSGVGTVNVDGAGSTWTNGNRIIIGDNGSGALNVTNGGTVTSGNGEIGETPTGVGVVTVDGVGSSWTSSGTVGVGGSATADAGTGTLNVQNDATVQIAETLHLWTDGTLNLSSGTLTTQSLSNVNGGTINHTGGTLTIDGGTFDGNLSFGNAAGSPTRILTNGATTTQSNLAIATSAAATAELNITGAGSALTDSSPTTVGASGVGRLNITDGGAVTSDGGVIGQSVGAVGEVVVDGTGSNWTSSDLANGPGLLVGSNGRGTLSITNGGTVTNRFSYLGGSAGGSEGIASVDGAGSRWNLNGVLSVGNSGSGTLGVTGGGIVESTAGVVGALPGASGNATVDGLGSTWTNSGDLFVGQTGVGLLSIRSGGSVSSDSGFIGQGLGGSGTVVVDGADSSWNNSSNLRVGFESSGSLTVIDGGTVSGAFGVIGDLPSVSGDATVSGTGSSWNSSIDLLIADEGTGLLIVDQGATTTNADGYIARQAGSNGSVRIDGAGSTWSSSGQLAIGGSLTSNGGTGTVDVTNDGLVQVDDQLTLWTDGTLNLDGGSLEVGGAFADGGGTFNYLSGAITAADPSQNFIVSTSDSTLGQISLGVFAIDTVRALNLAGATRVEAGGQLSFDGGSLTAASILLQPGASLHNTSAGSTVTGPFVATAGTTITVDDDLTVGDSSAVNGFYSNGTLLVNESTVTLQDANDAVFDSGTLIMLTSVGSGGSGNDTGKLAAANGLTLDFGGNITGSGTVETPDSSATPLTNNGNITGVSLAEPITLTGYVKGVGTIDNAVITGTDAPGFSPAAVNRGSVRYQGELEIELGGLEAGNEFDQLNHILGGGVAELGGTLDVQLLSGFTPVYGDSFQFLTADGGVMGTFDTLLLPDLGPLLKMEVLYGSNDVSVAVVAALDGDFDVDGDVDLADALLGQRTGQPLGNGSLWATNFGAGSATVSASTVIPEPTALAIAFLGSCLASRRRR